ncbi:MAG: hypothetical protein NVSMB24_19280 [Mucilaginibacter sp.]
MPVPIKIDTSHPKPFKPKIQAPVKGIVKLPTKKTHDTVKLRSQFNLPNATFNAPTQLGNGNTQNIVPELPDRVLNDVDKENIRSIMKPGYTIDMTIITSGSEETQTYGIQLLSYLQHAYIVSNSTLIGQSSGNRQRGRKRFYYTIDDAQKIVYILIQSQQ